MDPLDARWAANVAGATEGTRIVDPMCGTGGLLVEAGLVGSTVVGIDAQWKMTRGTRENLAAYLADENVGFDVLRGDATALPLRDDCADGVVVDVPYGRQSKVATHSLADLVEGALAETVRIASRAVVVADRSWDEAARDVGWQVDRRFERRVHGSLTRHVHVLSRA
jgi:tRNA (guanine10-N2)-dimethyltransferase